MGAGNWSAQDQTLRLSWVKLLDYFFTPKTASYSRGLWQRHRMISRQSQLKNAYFLTLNIETFRYS